MLSFSVPILFFLALSSGIALWTKRRVGFVIPFALMGATLVVYVSGLLFSSFFPGFVMLLAGTIALLLFQLHHGMKLGSLRRDVKGNLLTTGAFGYVVLAGLCSVLAWLHGSDPVYWDEFAHWGQMTKELCRLGTFYTVQGTTLLYHNDYPPIIPLWEALNCMLAGRFVGEFMYASLWLLQCALFLPLIEAAQKRSQSPVFALGVLACSVLFTLVCVPCFDGGRGSFWLSVYPDAVMALMAGLGFYLVAVWRPEAGDIVQLVALSLLICFLVLAKQAALFFVALMLLAVAGKAIAMLVRRQKSKRSSHWRIGRHAVLAREGIAREAGACLTVIGVVALFCIAVLAYVSWQLVVAASPLPSAHGQFSVAFGNIQDFMTVILGGGSSYQQQVASEFAEAIVSRPASSDYPKNVSYLILCGIPLGVLAVSCLPRSADRRGGICLLCLQLVAAILYAFFMLFMYLYSFSQADGLALVCFERYMNVCATANAFASFMFLFVMLSDGAGNGKPWGPTGSALAVNVLLCALLLCPSAMSQLQVAKDPGLSALKKDAKYLVNHVPAEQRVFIVNQGHPAFETLQIAYYADGVIVSRDVESAGFDAAERKWTASQREMLRYLADESYLYVKSVDQDYIDRYSDLFNVTLEEGLLYRISSVSDRGVYLEVAR